MRAMIRNAVRSGSPSGGCTRNAIPHAPALDLFSGPESALLSVLPGCVRSVSARRLDQRAVQPRWAVLAFRGRANLSSARPAANAADLGGRPLTRLPRVRRPPRFQRDDGRPSLPARALRARTRRLAGGPDPER